MITIMSFSSGTHRCSLRVRPLVAGLALALTTGAVAAGSGTPFNRDAAHFAGAAPAATLGVTHLVTTCSDQLVTPVCDGIDDGTLRKAYFCAQNGDSIDLTQLQCSVITLATVLTDGGGAYVTLKGPGKDKLKIDGGAKGRVLVHNGTGALYVSGLTLANGHLNNLYDYGGGGCIYSFGKVTLVSSSVSSCETVTSGNRVARGGAIFAKDSVALFGSSVTASSVYSAYGHSAGAGIYAHSVTLETSTISGNSAVSGHSYAVGGGAFASGNISANYATISGNYASQGAGVFSTTLSMFNSTVSGNSAFSVGGIYARNSAHVYNSTITANQSAIDAAGIFVESPLDIRLESTIVAGNKTDGTELDLGSSAAATVAGTSNLIMAHAPGIAVSADTLSGDPHLGPLRNNGGPTQTHALLAPSPAIDHGNNIHGGQADQRLFQRVVGSSPDIGAFESVDAIFADGFNVTRVVVQ